MKLTKKDNKIIRLLQSNLKHFKQKIESGNYNEATIPATSLGIFLNLKEIFREK